MNPVAVAWAGNFRHPWCSEVHFTASMESLGHRVVRLQEDELDWSTLPGRVAREGVQVLFWTRTWPAENAVVLPALDALRSAGIPSCSYHLDRWWGLNREHQVHDQPFFRTDLVVSPDDAPEWAGAGVNHLWLPPGVYDAECRIGRANPRRFPHRVVFVGSHPYPHPEWRPYRDELLARLGAHLGRDFAIWPRARQPVRGKALADLYASAEVVIGDSCLAGESNSYWSDRLPETMGRGGFLIHPEVAGMEDWYADGVDLATYPLGDFDALLGLVDEYLADPVTRGAIAAHGQATVLGRDTYRHRMATVLEVLDRDFGIPEARIPVSVGATVHAASDGPRSAVPRTRTRPPTSQPASRMTVTGRAALAERGVDLVTVRHRRSRQPARFETVGGPTAARALEEVFTEDTYRLEPTDVYGKVCLDIGGNLGGFAVLAARMGAAVVHTYEPHPASYAALVSNLARNGVAGTVTAHPEAVAAVAGGAVLIGEGGGAHVGGPGEGTAVACVGILDVLDVAGPGCTVGLMKVDVEGAEFGIFAGLTANVLHERVERIVLEVHGPGMPHLAHLDADGGHLGRWCALVAMLADCGRLEIMGHPMVGGLMWWKRY